MKLYIMPGACSLATHILLREAGQTFEIEKVGRDKKTESGADFMAINPKGYVPALEIAPGDVLTENVVVHGYVAGLNPAAKLAPSPGTKERLKLDELSVFISTEIHKNYGSLFSGYPDEVKAQIREKLAKRYELIEKLLSDGRPYLTGENFATADAYLFTVSRWAGNTGVDLSKFPNVLAFQKRVGERPAVKAALEAEGLTKAA
jgi:glutathione S-transferase